MEELPANDPMAGRKLATYGQTNMDRRLENFNVQVV